LCTHLIMMIFASAQLKELCNPNFQHLPFPLTYTIVIGKGFMVFRMVLAYSSANLGVSIDYFFWQELVLTLLHTGLATMVGDPSPEHSLVSYATQLERTFCMILGIDTLKTIAMVIFWYTFKPGLVAYHFNRFPSIMTALAASVLIHAILDMMQTAATMFTMFIGRLFVEMTSKQEMVAALPVNTDKRNEPPDFAQKLVGQWTDGNAVASFGVQSWEVPVPDDVCEDELLEIPTIHSLGRPQAQMKVSLPQGVQPGAKHKCMELRLHHPVLGYRSFDMATLSSVDDIKIGPFAPTANATTAGGSTESMRVQLIEDDTVLQWTISRSGRSESFKWKKVAKVEAKPQKHGFKGPMSTTQKAASENSSAGRDRPPKQEVLHL